MVADEAFEVGVLPRDDLVEEYRPLNNKEMLSSEPLSNKEINEIQTHLRTITCPLWNTGPPLNLGDPEHGKLKAESNGGQQ